MKLTSNKLSVILATVVAGVSIMANCMTARAAEPVKTGLNGRYVLAGRVDAKFTFDEVPGKTWYSIVDENGEEWVYTYDSSKKCVPELNQDVVMIMNSNGTPNDITDDQIEDILFSCHCEHCVAKEND